MQPKNSKHRKEFRGKRRGNASAGFNVDFGEYGLKSLGRGWLSAKQLEAARRAIAHTTSRGGKVWVRVFPHKPVSGRGAGVRMGAGKGDIVEHVAVIQPGRILFEIAGVSKELVTEAFQKATNKLPFRTTVVGRH